MKNNEGRGELGKWMIIVGIGLQFIPGLIGAFAGGGDDTIVAKVLAILSLPLIIFGGVLLFLAAAKKHKSAAADAVGGEAVVPAQRSRASLVGWNILAVILSLPVTFAILFAGGMAGDSGTPSAYAATYIIMGFGVLYFLSTLFCVYMSQTKRSLKWTIWPMVFPGALIAISMLAPLVLLPLLYSAGLR